MPPEIPSKTIKVLFVDDQEILLKAVERIVRRKTKNWKILLANSGQDAIEILKNDPIDVVVSDMRMPGIDGVDLLKYVKENHPNIIRFILSGHSNNQRTIEAVKVAHQYFVKPFSTHDLIDALQLTHSLYKRIRNPALQGLIASIDRLPTPRKVFYEINEVLEDESCNTEMIANLVCKDTAIAGKVLQVVNSAFFGQYQTIDSIQQAVGVLGIESIRSLVLIAGIASDHKELLNGIISIDLYSDHCMEVAAISKSIAKFLKKSSKEQDTLFTIGLLHDVGRLVLIKKYTEVYSEKGWREDPFTTRIHISQIESIAEDSTSIGAALVALWGLSPQIVNTIAFHEDLDAIELDDGNFSSIVHLANTISNYRNKRTIKPITEIESIHPQSISIFGGEEALLEWVANFMESSE